MGVRKLLKVALPAAGNGTPAVAAAAIELPQLAALLHLRTYE